MIRPIQYLRGLAAMMVVWHHSISQVAGSERYLSRIPEFGPYGVDLFFMISGFIMLVTTWEKPISPLEFMRHRIQRVVPLYWAATLLIILAAIFAPSAFKALKYDATSILKSLFFVPYESLARPGEIFPLLVPGWSLNYEMFFYVIFALLLLVGRNRRVPLMVGSLLVLVAAGRIWHPSTAPLQVYTDPRLLEFAAGMILGRLWVSKEHARRDGGHPVLMALGDASYSIYLSHLFTLGALRVVWVRLVPEATLGSSIALMAVSLTVSALAGWICFRLVERPISLKFKQWHSHAHGEKTHQSRAPGR